MPIYLFFLLTCYFPPFCSSCFFLGNFFLYTYIFFWFLFSTFFFNHIFFRIFPHNSTPVRLGINLVTQFSRKLGWARAEQAQPKNFAEKVFFGESVWTLADCEWHAAALGLKPLRLPRVPCTHTHAPHAHIHTRPMHTYTGSQHRTLFEGAKHRRCGGQRGVSLCALSCSLPAGRCGVPAC